MKRVSTFLAALLLTATATFADGPFRNHRYDSFKALQLTSENILFIGNSITDMHCWPEAFVTDQGEYLPIVNRGNSGTYSTEQSDNLESYINGKPKKVFMMIGTNDIATSGGLNASPEQVLAYIKSIVTRIHARSPETKVYLYSILKNNTSNRVEATWLRTSALIKEFADATDKVTYIDLYDKLANVAAGGAWSYDNLHLTAGAYQVWCKTICEHLEEGETYKVLPVYPENTLTLQNRGGLSNASHGMRATYFSCLPIKSNDVLVFGDAFIKNGEWQEFLGNRNVKNRGTGWNNSGEIAVTSGIVDATFATIDGVSKTAPKAMFLYTGTADACGSTDIATVKSNYKALVDKLTEKAPDAKIYLMAICPRNNASHNERIAELNAYMESLESDNIRFVDTYSPFINDEGTVNSKYVFSNDYIGGLAYIKIANLMKDALLEDFPSDTYNVTSDADAEVRHAQAGLRNQLTQVIARGLVATRGDEAGQYNATAMAAFDTKLTEANTLLEQSGITQDEVTTMANSLTTILNDALSMPTYSTQGNDVWYQLYTPGRGNKYLTSTGAGANVTSSAANNYATSMWKFVDRGNSNGLDIINRHDGSYLAPTAAGSTSLTTSAAQPASGWTLSYCDTPGLFIISSGSVQVHQTNGTEVWNWGGGANRSDAGCQYMVSIVTGEPEELPDPSLLTLTLTPTEFQKATGKSTWTYHGSTTSGGWYGKFVTGTTPALTAESTDAAANNIGWSSNQPWLKAGYTYNLTLPEGYVFVGYELTTKSTSGSYSNTFTYTTAGGTATSEAQSSSTAKTVTASGLNTNTITLVVNGEATSSNYGILITNLVIRYKEVLEEGNYSLELKESTGSFTTGSKVWSMATNASNPVALTFTSNANNMNVNDGYLQIHPGTAGTATYTIAVPAPYVITGYSFDYAFGSSGTGNKTITVGEQQYAVAAEKKTLAVTDLNTQTTGFTLSGSNQPVKLTNFIVTVINPELMGEDEADALEAAKTTAKATVTTKAANLKANVGYYSYTVAGAKVYEAAAVTAAIDAAATVAEVEAIVATYALNVPEVGKYYRIKSKSSGKYLDAAGLNNEVMNMKAENERDFLGSIFLLDEDSKWLNMATNTYIKDTHTIGADKAGANTWTFEASPRTMGCILLKSSGGSPYLHDSDPKANRCSGDGGHAAHDFMLEEVSAYSLTVDAPAIAGATATWNGETKTLPAVWALFEGTTITDATLTINDNTNFTLTGVKEGDATINGNTMEIATLTANRTITASFTPTFFSANAQNLVPVHIYSIRNKDYTICLNEADNYAGHAVNSGKTDYTLDEVWYLVGTAESFKMYSYTAGMGLALTLAGTEGGSAATMTANGTDLCMTMVSNGFTISPKGTPGQSFNMHGGAGADIKLYGSTDGGSVWGVNIIDLTKPLTLNVEVSGEQPYATNFRVVNLSTTIAGQTATSIITDDVEARTYYLPVGATFTLNNSYVYRGYTFEGFKDAQGNAAEYNEATIPAGGLALTAAYSVDMDNKYQYLFYSNDPVMNKPYRIPAIAVTRTGRVLAVTDHRPGGSDVGFAPVDIKLRYSEDNGKTWSDEEFIADGTGQHVTVGDVTHTNVFNYAFGDAAIVADRESDEVLIMCVGGKQSFPYATAESHNYTARLRSHDGGVTWDEPENVTANFMDITPLYNKENPKNYEPILPESYALFYGSGRILQSRVFKAEGSQYYRIYAAILVREVREGDTDASHNNYVVYSDNFGETWNLLGTRCVNGGDEAKVEELPDGTVIISSRKGYGRYFNIFTFTDIATGAGSWSTQVASENITGGIKYGSNACNGEFYMVKAVRNSDQTVCDVMMQSVPTGQRGDYTADGRNDVTIFFKEMNYSAAYTPTTFAENWTKGLVVSRVRSAYSTMDVQHDGKIAFFYEEDPESYSMVYVPLTLEEITDGAYSLYIDEEEEEDDDDEEEILPATAQVEHLLPLPQQVNVTQGTFALSGTVAINYAGGAKQCALLEEIFTDNGCTIANGGKVVNVSLVASIEGAHDYELYGYENEAYTLEITEDVINITAVTNTGVIRAAQTLTQLAEGCEGTPAFVCLTMKDWPAFKLRGYMHDVGRSFISIDELVKQIELFSRFKVNTFHWHLTENQAWRFEVKAYPELTSSESMTRFAGQYYTQEDCKRLMEVAKKHGVIVIPEIDMPGHSEAFERAMGFGMQTEEGKAVLKKVLDEVCEVFADAPYIHIGGDEVATTADYLNEMIAYVEGKGKKVEIWNPINGVGQDALNATYAQMWGTRGYLASGKANIDSRYNYTNHFDVFADLVGIYKSSIYYSQKGSEEVAGAISGCWNDRKVVDEVAIMAQNNVWANVIATAERAWKGGGKAYIDNATNTPASYKANPYGGGVMLPNSGDEYEEFKSWEERFLFHKANSLKDEPIPYVKQTNVRWRITDAFPNGGSETAAFGPEAAGITASTDLLPEVFEHEGKTYNSGMATGAGIYLAHTWGNSIINAYYSNPQYNHTAYAWTYVYSDKAQTVGAQIEFQNYSRSEQDAAAPEGKWDHYGSKIWINGVEIAAPTWENTGVSISSKEVELRNENFPGRKPIEVTLKQGWNKVFIKLPYFNKGYRLKKWMFTFVLTDLEGKNAVEGLIYSPNQCMDETTELVAAEISNIKRNRSNYVGTAVGLWPESAAATLDAKVKEVEATYSTTMTAEERKAQAAALQTAWADFVASLANVEINQPVSGNYYRMYTPLRASRYATGNGVDAAITGPTEATTKASIWKFVKRNDNSFDIINAADGTYISPASNNNTALKTVTAQPNAGWTIKKAENMGNVIVVSGSTQFNQQKDGNLHLLNWGSGTNTTDDGCEYRLVDVTSITPATPIKLLNSYEEIENGSIYTFVAERGWMGATASSSNAISTARTSVDDTNTDYFKWTVYKSNSGNYYLYNLGKEKFLGVQSSNNASIPFAAQPAGKLLTFKNSSSTTYPIMFSTDKAGVVNHSPHHGEGLVTWTGGWNDLDDEGSNHQVALISKLPEKTLQKIAAIVADYEFDDVLIKSAEEFENGGVYTFVTERGKMGATESEKVISTARTSVSDTNTNFFKWTVYKSNNGNYYLYNLGKQQFMGMQTANNTEIDFVTTPTGKKLTFKQSSSADYPIMFSTDNAGVVNHSTNHGGGLVNWTGGWNKLDDGGSNHKVTLVSKLPEATLQEIAAIVENYDKSLPIKVEVEGWTANNPNTHFGNVTATTGSNVSSTKLLIAHMAGGNMAYSSIGDEVTFTRAYRGFEFQGFYVGAESLGKSFTLTEAIRTSITEETPLVAKFTTTDDVTLFYDDDPFSYRIPAIATTSTGRLIAVSDYRYSLDDIGRYNFGTANPGIDLVIRMSDDNGKTWGETKTIAKGSCVRGTDDCAYGDAAIAVVGQKVLVMGAAGDVMFGNGSATAHNRTVRIFSEDNGENWTKPLDISETFFINADATINSAYSLFFGSGKLAVDENYNNTGNARIYGAVLVKKNDTNNGIYVVYTDDFGLTWSILGGSQTHIASNDEPKVEILPSGQILLSIRRGGGRQFNVFTYTDKGTNAGSWNGNADGCSNGGSNTCNGEIYLVDAKKADGSTVKLLLQSQPKGGSGLYDRRDVTIWYKEVDNTAYTSAQIASNWIEGMQVSTQLSAYSTMTLQKDGKIAFFFEEAPCYADDYTKGYSMVYVPLTIESITKGNYFSPSTDLEAETTINVTLTDAQGNVYHEQLTECTVGEVAAKLGEKYPFITLGDTPSLESDGTTYTYTNTVTLPFKVSSAETTIWHNMYIPSNTNTRYPVYFYAESNGNTTVKTKATSEEYGASDYNTQEHADKMSWAIYNVDNGFAFTFKNKLTGKYIKVAQPASSKSENVQYDTKENATAFSIEKNTSYRGDYIIKHETGHLSVYGAGDGYLTFFSGNYHWGSTVKIAEAPDFETLIDDINEALTSGLYGNSLGQYKSTSDITLEAISEAMENSNTVKLNTLNTYKAVFDGATLNMPKAGQYFRVAYDYGGNVGKLYMQGTASSVQGVAFTDDDTGNASIWLYHDGALYSYTAGKNLREHGNDRGLSDTKTTVVFSESSRAKGKYNVKCGSFIHANSSNGSYYTDHCSGDGGHAAHDLILEEVDMRPSTIVSTIGEYKVGTFYANEAVIIPEGIKAYVAIAEPVMDETDAQGNATGTITMTAIEDGIIPAQTGVLICGEPESYGFKTSTEPGNTNTEGNLMRGYAGSFEYENVELENGYTTYVLTVKDEVAGFYRKEAAFKVYYNKAYLQVPSTQAANLRIRFGKQEGTTDIESAVLESQGSVLIYDLTGRRVMNVGKGIYIVNGKKMIF